MVPTRAILARTEGRLVRLRLCYRHAGRRVLAVLALAVFLAGAPWRQVSANPLPPDPVEELRRVLAADCFSPSAPPSAVDVLAQRKRHLEEIARKLHFLGDVGRALLLQEWRTADRLDGEAPVPPEWIDRIVREPDSEGFQQALTNLLQGIKEENREDALRMAAAAIDRNVRLLLLEELELGLRSYLESGRPAQRIAAAELIGEAMINVRKQENAEEQAAREASEVPARRPLPGSTRFLRQHLPALTGDLLKLTRGGGDPEVQAAAARALGELEADPGECVAALGPLLDPARPVLVRRAAARAIGNMVATAFAVEKRDPARTLRTAEMAFPALAGGLADRDPQVRSLCVDACRQIAATLKEMTWQAAARGSDLATYKPLMAAVQKDLPSLNRGLQDPLPELRVATCHVLEDLALAAQRLQEEEALLLPEQSSRRPARRTPSDLAREAPRGGRPMQDGAVQVSSFAPKGEELPSPLPPELSLRGTVKALIDDLRAPDLRVRLAALDVLETLSIGKESQPRAVSGIPALVQAVSDPNKVVRWQAARTLGHLGPAMPRLAPRQVKPAVNALMALLNDQEDLGVRTAAAVALERFGPAARDAVQVLAQVLNRGDRDYRIAVLHAIQDIGTDALPALPSVGWLLIHDSNARVRIEAVRVLGHFGPLAGNALPALRIAHLHDPDAQVRQAAGTALRAVDPSQAR
jgi:HEAT repeat protein